MKISKTYMLQYLAAFFCVILIGCILEFTVNHKELSLNKSERKIQEIPMSQITFQGFQEKEGRLIFEHDEGIIHIDLGGRYVSKLGYSFEYDGLLNLDAYVGAYNAYGEVNESSEIHIEDRNSKLVKESYLTIKRKVDYVNLVVKQSELNEKGLSYIDFEKMPLIINGFFLKNGPVFNWYRLCFFWCVMGFGAVLWFSRASIGSHVEAVFLVMALSIGGLLVFALPAGKTGWDEEIHFERSFWLATYPNGASVSDSVMQEFVPGIDTWPYNQPGGLEEQRLLNSYLDEHAVYRNGNNSWRAATDKASFQGYLGQALLLKLGMLLHLPFSVLFRLGRLGNLFIYSTVMYFAIRKIPVGKGIMIFIALMPTPFFLACVYSYDPTVTACLNLSFAYMLSEILGGTGKVSWKSYAVILVSFIIGCRAKAVYAPLVLTALLIPQERFPDKRRMHLMRAGIVAVFVIMMASFVLPVLIAPSATGDLRGGATSEIGQMAYVLGKPIAYIKILLMNIFRSLPDYLAGESVYGTLGHLGSIGNIWLLYVGAVIVVLTNTQSSTGKALKGKHKAWIFILCALTMGLVWTSMYMAYTVPGMTYIEGVQGRYYLPFLLLIYLIFNSRKIVVHMNNNRYYGAVLGMSGGILLYGVFAGVLMPYCF